MNDTWTIILSVGQWALNLVFGAAFWWLKQKTEETEKLKDEVKSQAEEQIELKLQTVLQAQTLAIQAMQREMSEMRARLDRGDNDFRTLASRDHTTEMKILAAVNELKEYVRERCADRDGVQRLATQVATLTASVARMQAIES